jgi:hypothetical protein
MMTYVGLQLIEGELNQLVVDIESWMSRLKDWRTFRNPTVDLAQKMCISRPQ